MLTPNILVKGSPTQFLEENLDKLHYLDEEKQVTKRTVYLHTTRQLLKKRWMTEYLHALRDQRNKVKPQEIPQAGSVVLITDNLNDLKPTWNLAKVIEEIRGKDGVIRGLILKSITGYIVERRLQLIRDVDIRGAA